MPYTGFHCSIIPQVSTCAVNEAKLIYRYTSYAALHTSQIRIRENRFNIPPFRSIPFIKLISLLVIVDTEIAAAAPAIMLSGFLFSACLRPSPSIKPLFPRAMMLSRERIKMEKILLHSKNLLEPSWQAWGKTKSCSTGKTRD